MPKFKTLFILILGFLLLLSLSCQSNRSYILQIYSVKQDRIVKEFNVSSGSSFQLEYIHSSEKTPISDYFIIDNNKNILLKEERFNWYAVGLECHPFFDKSEIIFDGGITRVVLNRTFDVFPIRVGWIAQQKIIIQDQIIKLKDITEPGDLLKFYVVEK